MRVFDTSSLYTALKKDSIGLLLNAYTLTLAKYEFGNAIWKEVKLAKSITAKEAEKVLNFMSKIFEKMKIIEPDHKSILNIATDFHLNYYDASYLQASYKLQLPLITEDQKLKNAANKHIKVYSFDEII